jgi:dephospho-CoA kinase
VLRVGLTGNVAAGKSSVAARWRQHGAWVIDADALARAAVAPGTPGWRAVVEAFGPEVLAADGTLDRAALRRLVFADDAARRRLEAIVHPEVARLRAAEHARARAAGAPVVVDEIPLLFEAGLDRDVDVIVLVDAPEAVRRQRLRRDRGLDDAEIDGLLRAQWPAERKRARADYVIDNDADLATLERRADAVWQELLRRTGADS